MIQDPQKNPDRRQNVIDSSFNHTPLLQKISQKSIHKFFRYPADRQTDAQTDDHITSLAEVMILPKCIQHNVHV